MPPKTPGIKFGNLQCKAFRNSRENLSWPPNEFKYKGYDQELNISMKERPSATSQHFMKRLNQAKF